MKKILLFSLFYLLFSFSATQPAKTQISTHQANETYIITSRSFASNELIAPYSAFDSFTSGPFTADFDFTTVGLSWQQTTSDDARVEAYIRFRQGKDWSEWLDLEEEEDLINPGKYYSTASANPSQAFEYRFDLYAADGKSPVVKNIDYTFIKTVSADPKPAPKTAALPKSLDLQSQVITRSQWGANENLRYLAPEAEQILIERDPDFYEKYKDELQYSHVVDGDENGRYVWPLQYPEFVSKVVVHHTATTKDLDNPSQAIRDIYTYHAATRGWGDIGYNYIVDREGKIYEGRAGGESVIGAHAGPGNHGSIGIALLGNYQDEPVPEAALTNLSQFIYQKSKIYGFTPDGTSDFRGEERPNVFGHRDIMSTTCPGQYLYEKIPFIRTLAANAFKEKPKFVTDYDFVDQSKLYYIELLPEESRKFTIKLENIGTKSWDKNTVLTFQTSSDFANTLSFPSAKNQILAPLNESSVDSGQVGTFDFTLTAGQLGKTVYLQIKPMINGQITTEDQMSIAVSIQPPIYSYEILDATYPPETLKSGTTFDGTVTVRNSGNVTWQNLTFANQPGNYTVLPDETVTFPYKYTAPKTSGELTQTLALNLPNAKFASSEPISFTTIVYRGDYDSILYTKTPASGLTRGETSPLTISLKNNGLQTWSEDQLRAVFLKQPGFEAQNLHMTPKTVKMGEIAKITFDLDIANDAPTAGIFLVNFFQDTHRISRPIAFNFSTATAAPIDTENQIRVKLSSLNVLPEITADGSFSVYSGDKFLKNLSAGDTVKVTYQAGKFAVVAAEEAYLENGPIRLIPKNSAILQIKNFEHRPAWNQDLNDNQYRGILEIRAEDSQLIVINELHLEDYLKGLGEVSNTELPEKIKAIIVAARSYAKFYTTKAEKFPGKPYHLDDNPEVSQKYLGYGLEKRSPNVAAGVEATRGEVVGYNGQVVKAPYFNQSDGVATKSAKEVWGWTDTPYLISVPDTTCDGDKFLGHGVGLSGCGAKGLAAEGQAYDQILKHYYTGIEILDLY